MFKSYWYYWHTGQKLVALVSMILTALLVGAGMFWAVGFSLWGIILAVLLDTVGFFVAIIYALVLREYLPTMFVPKVDELIIYQFVIPTIAVFILGRLVTFVVAKFFAAQVQSVWLRKTALGVIGLSVLSFGVGLVVYQEQQRAAAEAARLEAEANAITFAKIKAQAGNLTHQAQQAMGALANSTSEAATATLDQTKALTNQALSETKALANQAITETKTALEHTQQAASEAASKTKAATGKAWDSACIKLAETLGKSPSDYCATAPAPPSPTTTPPAQ